MTVEDCCAASLVAAETSVDAKRVMKIYFVRHGSNLSAEARPPVYPSVSDPLSPRGLFQVRQLLMRIEHLSIDLLLTSDVTRARQTAEIIAKHRGITFMTNPLFGEWLAPKCVWGKSVSAYPEPYLRFRIQRSLDRCAKYEDGESLMDVITRVRAAKQYLSQLSCDNIIVISHFYFIRFFATDEVLPSTWSAPSLMTAAAELELNHAGICLFKYDKIHDRYRSIFWNQQGIECS
jgi:broad specificity phosphatase PhoE